MGQTIPVTTKTRKDLLCSKGMQDNRGTNNKSRCQFSSNCVFVNENGIDLCFSDETQALRLDPGKQNMKKMRIPVAGQRIKGSMLFDYGSDYALSVLNSSRKRLIK